MPWSSFQQNTPMLCMLKWNLVVKVHECQVLYQRLQNSVWHLPSYFDSVRPRLSSDPIYVVTEVFNLVRKKTGQPVISLIDLNPSKNSSSGGNKPDPDARAFVREVKHLAFGQLNNEMCFCIIRRGVLPYRNCKVTPS